MKVVVQNTVFDFAKEAQTFTHGCSDKTGATVTFSGVVRADDLRGLEKMEIEHYPAMTEAAITDFAHKAMQRWQLDDILVIHRYGIVYPQDMIMMVATAAAHRVAAFEAAEFLMDYLKSRAPFWKKEFYHDGADWVAAKDHDEDALSRWDL